MKVKDFIKKAIEVERKPTLYGWGKYMNRKDGKYLLCDCSGLIKGILWGYPENGKYKNNGVPDINADTMISKCSKLSLDFNKLPIGALVWMKGHIGIHVGNGECIESSPAWENGIQCTFIQGSGYTNTRQLKERKWSKQGLFDNYIDYSESSEETYNLYHLLASTNIYINAINAKNNENVVGTYDKGEYYVFNRSMGMINIGKSKGVPGGWINPIQQLVYYPQYNGTSTKLDYILETIEVPLKYYGHWKKRKLLAEHNGINDYIGSTSQNQKLITLAKQGRLKKL